MSSPAERRVHTPEQYLALERQSSIKHEYYNGEMFAMAGTSREHNLIAGNLFRVVGNQFVDRPCEVYMSDVRVLVSRTGLYAYPDVVALCGQPRFEDSEVDTLLNPSVIVEVLSSSTEAYDRGKMFAHYRRLESLREYVLISQEQVRVERYTRQGEGWVLSELNDLEDSLRLASIDCEVSLRKIYAKVEVASE